MTTNSKLQITIDTMFIGSHTEVASVPADVMDSEIQDLISLRFETVDPTSFDIDPSQGSRYGSHAELVDDDEDHTLEIVRGTNGRLMIVSQEERASVTAEAPKEGLVFIQHDEDQHTIIAALRFWQEQGMCEPTNRSEEMHQLCTNNDELTSASVSDVNDLVLRLNVEMKPKAFMADLKAII